MGQRAHPSSGMEFGCFYSNLCKWACLHYVDSSMNRSCRHTTLWNHGDQSMFYLIELGTERDVWKRLSEYGELDRNVHIMGILFWYNILQGLMLWHHLVRNCCSLTVWLKDFVRFRVLKVEKKTGEGTMVQNVMCEHRQTYKKSKQTETEWSLLLHVTFHRIVPQALFQASALGLMVDSCAPCDSQQITWWPRHCTDSFLRQSALNFVLHPTTLQGSQRVNEWCKEIRIYRLFLTCSYGFCVFRRALSLFHYCSACAHILSGQLICNQVDFPKMCTSGWSERLGETVWNVFLQCVCLCVFQCYPNGEANTYHATVAPPSWGREVKWVSPFIMTFTLFFHF